VNVTLSTKRVTGVTEVIQTLSPVLQQTEFASTVGAVYDRAFFVDSRKNGHRPRLQKKRPPTASVVHPSSVSRLEVKRATQERDYERGRRGWSARRLDLHSKACHIRTRPQHARPWRPRSSTSMSSALKLRQEHRRR